MKKRFWSPKLFEDEFRNLLSRLWVLMVNEIPVGHICFWMYGSEIQLLNIAIHPINRGKGFGHYLLSEMIEFGASNGVRSIWLEVRPSNLAAQKLYEKNNS